MVDTLVIAEKSKAAKRLAYILSPSNRYITRKNGAIYYFSYDDGNDTIYIVGLRGHIVKVEYPQKYKSWELGNLKDVIYANPIVIPSEKEIVATLKMLGKKVNKIIVATDYDREGELIGKEAIDIVKMVGPRVSIERAQFSSLTNIEVIRAFKNLVGLDYNLASAGETRQFVDLVWGAVLTRFFSLSTGRRGKGFLSVGRVQSPTLCLIVEREKKILNFKPTPYWKIKANLTKNRNFDAWHTEGKFTDKKVARDIFTRIESSKQAVVSDVDTTRQEAWAPPPLDTTELVRLATGVLGWNAKKVLDVSESIYLKGICSYPRTDNTVYPIGIGLKNITMSFFNEYPTTSSIYDAAGVVLGLPKIRPSKGKIQTTDHPPIHPTGLFGSMNGDESELFDIIVRRFLATLMPNYVYEYTKVELDIDGEFFITVGSRIIEMGWRDVYQYGWSPPNHLPSLKLDEKIPVNTIILIEKTTQPPSRFSQGTLVSVMQNEGLGTKSTRAEIISKLYNRGYVEGNIRPTQDGMALAELLMDFAPGISKPTMTKELEVDMDMIADGQNTKDKVLTVSRDNLDKIIDGLLKRTPEISKKMGSGAQQSGEVVGPCPDCGKDLKIRRSRKGKRFVGCSGYPGCSRTFPLPGQGDIKVTGAICVSCNTPKVVIKTKGKQPWNMCLDMNCPSKK